MNDEQIKKLLELWRGKVFLTYSEAFDLMCGILPGEKIKFSNERNTSDYMESLDFDDLRISTDIEKFRLKVYFDIMYSDEGKIIPLSPPQYATKETLKQFLPPSLCDDEYEWWCSQGKVSAQEFKECLQRHNIPSSFFRTAVHLIRNYDDQETSPQQSPTGSINTTAPTKANKKYRPRGAISAVVAATFLGISSRQVQNWDKGINRPDDYPGRADETLFQMFVTRWNQRKKLTAQARAMNKAVSDSEAVDRATKSAFDDDY